MAAETEARAKLVEEHFLAEVEHDVERIMRTWGASRWFDDAPGTSSRMGGTRYASTTKSCSRRFATWPSTSRRAMSLTMP